MSDLSAFVERAVSPMVPRGASAALAHLGRLYVRRAGSHFGKRAIVQGRFVFRLCHWHRLRTTAPTAFGTRHKVQFPDKIQRYIFYFGVWEPAITAFIRGSLAPGDKFVDVGANIGYYTCLAATLVGPSGAVYAIEASPRIFALLQENVELNGLTNVHAYNNAVFDRSERLQLFSYKETNIGRTSLVRERPGAIVEEVDARPLPELIDWSALRNVRLIKIDVEGAEWPVIKGVSDLLKHFAPSTEWLVEINPAALRNHGATPGDFVELFTSAGYRMYTIENRYHVDWYVRERELYMAQPVEKLVRAPPSEIRSQIDVLFTKRAYGGSDAGPGQTAAPAAADHFPLG
jgi:FkbM family methyltransferase